MSSKQRNAEEGSSDSRRKKVLVMLFYPFTLTMVAAGFAAFFLLVLGYSVHLAATVLLCFFGFSSTVLYFISKPTIEAMNLRVVFLNIVAFADILAFLSLISLIFS